MKMSKIAVWMVESAAQRLLVPISVQNSLILRIVRKAEYRKHSIILHQLLRNLIKTKNLRGSMDFGFGPIYFGANSITDPCHTYHMCHIGTQNMIDMTSMIAIEP